MEKTLEVPRRQAGERYNIERQEGGNVSEAGIKEYLRDAHRNVPAGEIVITRAYQIIVAFVSIAQGTSLLIHLTSNQRCNEYRDKPPET